MLTRELFLSAMEANKRARVVRAELDALREAEVHGATFGMAVSRGHYSDPTASNAVAVIRRAERLRNELDELDHVINQAASIVRGASQALGDKYARALQLRYLDGLLWADVAEKLGVSRETARTWTSVAFDWADSVGPVRACAGVGFAE